VFVFLGAANADAATIIPNVPSETYDIGTNSVYFGELISTFDHLTQGTTEPTYVT